MRGKKEMNKLLLVLITIMITGCAAGMVGVHKGNVAAGEAGLYSLGPESEDTSEEARKRVHFNAMIEEAEIGLHEIAEQARTKQ
jgi:hypothetical protein